VPSDSLKKMCRPWAHPAAMAAMRAICWRPTPTWQTLLDFKYQNACLLLQRRVAARPKPQLRCRWPLGDWFPAVPCGTEVRDQVSLALIR